MRFLSLLLVVASTAWTAGAAVSHAQAPAGMQVGYTEFRTNLPGGRHGNVVTMRACVIKGDGTGRRILGESLTEEANSWTQFAGWSPDGKLAILGRNWESAENGEWEEKNKTFRFDAKHYLFDICLLDLENGKATNVTAKERVSFYNSGLFFWPGDPAKLGFQALIDGNMHPFAMDRNGTSKRDLTKDSKEFAYGFNVSRDGKRIAYHKNYQVYVAQADGSEPRRIKTGKPFEFAPQWSPDGSALLFLAGEHYDCHPYVARMDGGEPKKIADRRGYKGVIEFLDVPDFHGGSSDVPTWAGNGRAVIYTAAIDGCVELFRTTLEGATERLTKSAAESLHYHPTVSPDGRWLAYGSKREGVRNLYAMNLETKREHRLTDLPKGHAAMWPHWRPAP